MSKTEVLEVALKAFGFKMGTIMLQSGELDTPQRFRFITEVVKDIRSRTIAMDLEKQGRRPDIKVLYGTSSSTLASGSRLIFPGRDSRPNRRPLLMCLFNNFLQEFPVTTEGLGLCVALSAGEMSLEQLKQLKEAGASRYLVRIETSNPELFSRIHPPEQSFSKRVSCLENIKAAGLQLGTGRLPSSTLNKALPCWNEEMQAGKCRHLRVGGTCMHQAGVMVQNDREASRMPCSLTCRRDDRPPRTDNLGSRQ